MLTFTVNQNAFFFYMCLLHVPNHYYNNRHVINKGRSVNFALILGFTFILTLIGEQSFAFEPFFHPLYKGVVISHVIYQELYFHKKYLSPNNNTCFHHEKI